MRIYIAGALSTLDYKPDNRSPSTIVVDYIANLSKMCKIASQVRKLGHYPYVPGMDFMLGVVNGDWEEDEYRGTGMSFLEVCDAVLVTSWSWGVRKEVERALVLGIPVLNSISDLPRPS